jgi:hypothetical protein
MVVRTFEGQVSSTSNGLSKKVSFNVVRIFIIWQSGKELLELAPHPTFSSLSLTTLSCKPKLSSLTSSPTPLLTNFSSKDKLTSFTSLPIPIQTHWISKDKLTSLTSSLAPFQTTWISKDKLTSLTSSLTPFQTTFSS